MSQWRFPHLKRTVCFFLGPMGRRNLPANAEDELSFSTDAIVYGVGLDRCSSLLKVFRKIGEDKKDKTLFLTRATGMCKADDSKAMLN